MTVRKSSTPGGTRYPTPTATVRTNWSYRPITQPIPRRRFRTNSTAVFGVRNIAATTDTVYVVTGAILQTAGNHEAITWITPKSDSKRCPVPNYYYKALLKVRRDASNKVTSAMTIGFWMEHREYSNDSYTNYATSVAEIERLTGFDFFANLPADIQAAAEQNSNWNTFASF